MLTGAAYSSPVFVLNKATQALRLVAQSKSSVTAHAKTFDEALRNCASRIVPGTERATEIMLLTGGASLETSSVRARDVNCL